MEAVKVGKAHVMAVPLPAQGHVKPLLHLCRCIAKRGIKVTFVTVQSVQDKIFATPMMSEDDGVVFAVIPDAEDPNMDFGKLKDLAKTMPRSLEELIGRINGSNPEERISCVVADIAVGFVVEAARKMGAEALLFSPASAAFFALSMHVPKLLQDGIIDPNDWTNPPPNAPINFSIGEVSRHSTGIEANAENQRRRRREIQNDTVEEYSRVVGIRSRVHLVEIAGGEVGGQGPLTWLELLVEGGGCNGVGNDFVIRKSIGVGKGVRVFGDEELIRVEEGVGIGDGEVGVFHWMK